MIHSVTCEEGKYCVTGTGPQGSGVLMYTRTLAGARVGACFARNHGGQWRAEVNPFYGTRWDRFVLWLKLRWSYAYSV